MNVVSYTFLFSLPLPPDSVLVVKSAEGRLPRHISVNSHVTTKSSIITLHSFAQALAAYSDFFKGLFFGSFKSQLINYEILEEDIESFETMLKLLDLNNMDDVSITVDNGI